MDMLKEFMPESFFQPAPSISDRLFWNRIASEESGINYLNLALKELDKAPEVPISDETYREANLQGSRGMYKPRH
jgi:hypothetical protein